MSSPQKNLIIASGDCSDADGFMLIPMYKSTGADLLYFVNYSAIFNDDNKIMTLEDKCNLRAKEYPVCSSAEYAITPSYVHRGNWLEYYSNTFRNFQTYAEVDPSFQKYLNKDGMICLPDENGEQIELSKYTKGMFFTNDAMKNLKKDILKVFHIMVTRLVENIWNETTLKDGITPGELFVVGEDNGNYHLNSVNAFGLYLLSDDVMTYGSIVPHVKSDNAQGQAGLPNPRQVASNPVNGSTDKMSPQNGTRSKVLQNAIGTQPTKEMIAKAKAKFHNDISGYEGIYIDFNGSMAFYSYHGNLMKSVWESGKVKGVYMMGGVETHEPPKTISMFSIVRYACATMNQLFHPENTLRLIRDYNDALKLYPQGIPFYVGTNNMISNSKIWNISGDNAEVVPVSLKKLFTQHNKWIADSDTLLRMMFVYYGDDAKLMKLYDVPVGMHLVNDILKNTAVKYEPKHMFVQDRGVCLVSKTENTNLMHAVREYGPNLMKKYHPLFIDKVTGTIPPFHIFHGKDQVYNHMQDEIRKLHTVANEIGCPFPDMPILPITTTNSLSRNLVNMHKSKTYKVDVRCIRGDEIKFQAKYQTISERWVEDQAQVATKSEVQPQTKTSATRLQAQAVATGMLQSKAQNVKQTQEAAPGMQQVNASVAQPQASNPRKMNYIFNFTKSKVIVFSDWEGGVPVKAGTKIHDYLLFEDDKLTIKNKDTGILFLGDLIDNANYGLRLMKSMLDLVTDKSNEVLLIGGNRDFNKIRFADEMCVKRNEVPCIYKSAYDGASVKTFTDAVIKLASTEFAGVSRIFPVRELVKGYQVKPWHVNNYDLYNRAFTAESVERILLDMYTVDKAKEYSMDPMYNELIELKLLDKTQIDTEKAKLKDPSKFEAMCKRAAILIFNMLASREWEPTDLLEFKGHHADRFNTTTLNGMYKKYLEKCDICRLFSFDNKYGFASHGGVSPFEDTYTNLLGASYDITKLKEHLLKVDVTNKVTFVKKHLSEIIHGYHKEIIVPTFAKLVGGKDISGINLVRDDPTVLQLIHTTAMTKYGTENKVAFHHSLSPILGYQPPTQGKALKFGGRYGSRKYMDRTELYYASFTDGTIDITWNIYGHQPRGLFPSVSKNGNTYHVCLDVSKIEGQTNKQSYTAMIIEKNTGSQKTDSKIFGYIPHFNDVSDNTDIYKVGDTTGLIANKNFVYDDDIDVFIERTKHTANIKYEYDVSKVNITNTEENPVFPNNVQLSIDNIATYTNKDNTKYMYHSEFMGTSPSPVIYNKVFIIEHTNMTGHLPGGIKSVGPSNVFKRRLKQGGGQNVHAKLSLLQQEKLAKLKHYAKIMKIKNISKMSEKELIFALKQKLRKHKQAYVS